MKKNIVLFVICLLGFHLNGNSQWKLLNSEGVEIVSNPEYSYSSVNEGMITISTNQGYGYLDKSGKVVIEPIYKGAYGFKDGSCFPHWVSLESN